VSPDVSVTGKPDKEVIEACEELGTLRALRVAGY